LQYNLVIEAPVLDKLAEAGFDPVYGARSLKRTIRQQLEDPLAQDLLGGKFSPGNTIDVRLDAGGKLFFAKLSD
jgi:ATP-dependent Clp protease ATP-binding subunit ClpB